MKNRNDLPPSVGSSDLPRGIRRKNPILAKEMRGLFRQQRSRIVLSLYLIFVAVITFLLYFSIISTNAFDPDPDVRRTMGKIIFLSLAVVQLLAAIFIGPMFSADSVSIERENRTLDLLQITSMPASSIILGKLFASIRFAMLFILVSFPLQSAAYLLSGMTPIEFLASVVLLVTTTVFVCSMSVWASTRFGRTSSAVGLAQLISGVLLLGFPILVYVIIRLSPVSGEQGFFELLSTISKNLDHPFQIIVIIAVWFFVSSNPISAAVVSYMLLVDEGVHGWYNLEPFYHIPFSSLAPWILYALTYGFFSWFLYLLAVRRIKRRDV